MIVAIPDGWSRWGCGQWVDSPVTGNFEQYLLHDVVTAVDAAYRTIPDPGSRGVFGFSSGGFGAWNVGSRNPDMFGALAMLSGDSFLDMTHKFMPYKYYDSIWPEAPDGPIEGNVWSQLVYDYSATYSPNPDNPPFCRSARGLAQRRVDPGGLGPLARLRPGRQRPRRLDNLRKRRASCSTQAPNDDYNLQWGHRLLSHYLDQAGITHEQRRTQGTMAAERTRDTKRRSNGSRRSCGPTSREHVAARRFVWQ